MLTFSASSHLPYAIGYDVSYAVLYVGSDMCPFGSCTRFVAEASSRATCPPPYSICYTLYAICYFIGFGRHPLDVWSSLRCGGHLEGILLSATHHLLYAICYFMGSSICPVEIWSSLRCGGFLWVIMLSALSHCHTP